MKEKYYSTCRIADDFDAFHDDCSYKKQAKRQHLEDFEKIKLKRPRVIFDTQNFKCRQCGTYVTANREISGVNNRNHCPHCLWSRHMDNTPGDRMSDCLSRMEPIGLTLKRVKKRYGGDEQGELMLIHQCTGCEKISINRIAGDDDSELLYSLYRKSIQMANDQRTALGSNGIFLLDRNDENTVTLRIFGFKGYTKEEKSMTIEVCATQ